MEKKELGKIIWSWVIDKYIGTKQIREKASYLKDCMYLPLERGEGRGKRGRETLMCERNTHWLPPACTLTWGPGLHPRHLPWPGIKPVTFCFAGQHPTNWATPLRARQVYFFKTNKIIFSQETQKLCKKQIHHSLTWLVSKNTYA